MFIHIAITLYVQCTHKFKYIIFFILIESNTTLLFIYGTEEKWKIVLKIDEKFYLSFLIEINLIRFHNNEQKTEM